MTHSPESTELIPGLPQEIALECLARLPYTCHHSARGVCAGWRHLIDSREFFLQRRASRNTHELVACLVRSFSVKIVRPAEKPVSLPVYRLAAFDTKTGTWQNLSPVPGYADGLPLFCRAVGVEGELVVMGGWDPASWDPVRHVYVYEFRRRRWRRGRDMPDARSFFAAGAVGGRVVVAGGHDGSKNALRTATVYDVERDEWEAAPEMSEERDECEGLAAGGEFWVVSGYSTESQGRFGSSAEAYDVATRRWRRVEGAWGGGRCPRGCVRMGGDGRIGWWGEEVDSVAVHVVVGLGDRAVVAGSDTREGAHGLYILEIKEGEKGRLEKLNVEEEFSGFVQSGCCVEI